MLVGNKIDLKQEREVRRRERERIGKREKKRK